jgi:hypothetical protein
MFFASGCPFRPFVVPPPPQVALPAPQTDDNNMAYLRRHSNWHCYRLMRSGTPASASCHFGIAAWLTCPKELLQVWRRLYSFWTWEPTTSRTSFITCSTPSTFCARSHCKATGCHLSVLQTLPKCSRTPCTTWISAGQKWESHHYRTSAGTISLIVSVWVLRVTVVPPAHPSPPGPLCTSLYISDWSHLATGNPPVVYPLWKSSGRCFVCQFLLHSKQLRYPSWPPDLWHVHDASQFARVFADKISSTAQYWGKRSINHFRRQPFASFQCSVSPVYHHVTGGT